MSTKHVPAAMLFVILASYISVSSISNIASGQAASTGQLQSRRQRSLCELSIAELRSAIGLIVDVQEIKLDGVSQVRAICGIVNRSPEPLRVFKGSLFGPEVEELGHDLPFGSANGNVIAGARDAFVVLNQNEVYARCFYPPNLPLAEFMKRYRVTGIIRIYDNDKQATTKALVTETGVTEIKDGKAVVSRSE